MNRFQMFMLGAIGLREQWEKMVVGLVAKDRVIFALQEDYAAFINETQDALNEMSGRRLTQDELLRKCGILGSEQPKDH